MRQKANGMVWYICFVNMGGKRKYADFFIMWYFARTGSLEMSAFPNIHCKDRMKCHRKFIVQHLSLNLHESQERGNHLNWYKNSVEKDKKAVEIDNWYYR